MALSQEAVQSMLDAMKIISSAEMNNISYDTTIVCTITDTSHAAKESYYMVTDGSVKFKAYVLSTEDTTKYKVDDQVYVKVPCGDFTRQKVIEGYYVADSAEIPATYVSPLQGFLNMTSLSDDTENGHFTDVDKALIANKSDKIALWQWSITPSSANADDLQMNGLYDTLIVQADFQSLMSNRRMYSGTYGLQLDLYVRLHPTSELHTVKTVKLDSSEMFGNPYAFSLYSTQAKSFDISSIGIVDGMTLYFYQNNDFNYYNDKGVVTRLPQAVNPNLLAKNVYVAMGSDITRIADNSIKLYTLEDQAFKYSEAGDSTNKKNIGFVWYNKDEDNNYVGFSDGVTYPEKDTEDENDIFPYDELAYIDLTIANSRLVAQQGKAVPTDRNGLTVSANVTDAETTIKSITTLLQVELRNTLNALNQRVSGLSKITDTLTADEYFRGATDPVYTGKIKDVQNYADIFIEETNKMILWYKDALAAACAVQTHQTQETTPDTPKTFTVDETVNYSPWIYYRETFKPSFYYQDFILGELKIAIEERYNGFQSQYDTYSIKLKKIFDDLDAAFKQLEDLLNGQKDKITSTSDKDAEDKYQYHINREIIPFESEDFSKYDNRYCVYWYRYDEHYTGDPILEAGWKRLEAGAAIQTNSSGEPMGTMPQNLGLPSEYSNVNTDEHPIYHLAARPKPEESFLTVYLNPEKKEEKFKVVIFYNHEKFVSDELVFTNSDELVDTTTLDVNGSIKISHGTQSKDSYQTFYNSNNTLINQADSSTGRQLSVSYDGAFGDNNSLAEAQIFWYVPRNSTMLDVNIKKLTDTYKFTTDYYRTLEVKEGKTAIVYTGPDKDKYSIAQVKEKLEDGTETENMINLTYAAGTTITKAYDKRNGYYSLTPACDIGSALGQWVHEDDVTVVDNDETYMDGYACFYKTIGFTEEETEEGEEKIKVVKSDDLTFEYKIKNYYVSTALNNTIFCIVKKLEYVFETSILMTFGTQGTCGTDYTLLVQPSTTQRGVTNSSPLPLSLQLFNYNNEEVPINGTDSNASNLRVKWFGPSTYLSSIETKVDGDGNETGDTNEEVNSLTISLNALDEEVAAARCGIAQVEVTINDEKYGGVADLSVKYPVAYSAGDYYIEGPTTVIYDSTGNNPLYYKEKYKLFKESTNEPVDQVIWNLQYYMFETPTNIVDNNSKPPQYMFERDSNQPTGFVITKFGDGETVQSVSDEVGFYHGYMPQLDAENKLIPSAIYIGEVYDDTSKSKFYLNAYPVVCAYEKSIDDNGNVSRGTLLWAQPIVIDQNRYPNSVTNAWDGKFKIDEKNGTIMSSMIGAGYKNTDNTYSGVLMGNISGEEVVAAGNKTDVGVYGFHHGAQSFGLNIDGTAFFGKSGRGRILIDGNSGTISSASYAQTVDSGMMIDLDDGFIDMRGGTEFLGEEVQITAQGEVNEEGIVECTYLNNSNESVVVFIPQDRIVEHDGNFYITPDWTEELIEQTKCQTYEDYVRKYGRLYRNDATHSNIHIDVKSPYFDIFSSRGKNIIHIANDQYYLQSDNYISGQYVLKEGIITDENGYLCRKEIYTITQEDDTVINVIDKDDNLVYKFIYVDANGNDLIDDNGDFVYIIPQYIDPENVVHLQETSDNLHLRILGQGQGTKLDLQNGTFDAYNLLLTSKNVYLDSRPNADPFFVIRDNDGCNLIYAGSKDYYLKTHGYSETDCIGLKIDLQNGSLKGYNFSLMANATDKRFTNSYILLDSGSNQASPALLVHYVENEMETDAEGKIVPVYVNGQQKEKYKVNMLQVGGDAFVLRSKDWKGDSGDDSEDLIKPRPIVTYQLATLKGISLNIRRGPNSGKDANGNDIYTDIGGVGNGATVKVYNFYIKYPNNYDSSLLPEWCSITDEGVVYCTWFSLEPPLMNNDGQLIDENGNIIVDEAGNLLENKYPVFAQGNDSTGRWVSRFYKNSSKYWTVEDTLYTEELVTSTDAQQGTKIDVGAGHIIMHKNDLLSVDINSQAEEYPLQIGQLDGAVRNFRVGWDGSLHGGTVNKWKITKDGTATFRYLNANGGTMNSINITGEGTTIHDASIANLTATGNIYMQNAKIYFGEDNAYYMASSSITETDWGWDDETGEEVEIEKTVYGLGINGSFKVSNFAQLSDGLSVSGDRAASFYTQAWFHKHVYVYNSFLVANAGTKAYARFGSTGNPLESVSLYGKTVNLGASSNTVNIKGAEVYLCNTNENKPTAQSRGGVYLLRPELLYAILQATNLA